MPPSDPRSVPLIGRIAVAMKLLTPDQLAELTRSQAKDGSPTSLGELMVERGWIDRGQLKKLLEAQKQVVAKHRAKAALERADAEPEVAPAAAREIAPPATDSLFDDEPAPVATPPPSARPAPARAAAAPPAPRPAATAPAPGPALDALAALLREGVERGASDVHVHAGIPLRFRLHGAFVARDDAPIPAERAEALVCAALTAEQLALLDERGQLDFALALPGIGRFRVNAFREQRGKGAVFRAVPAEPPTLDELGLPASLAKFTNYHQGMVLVTGPANCGKSSTLAALVRILNEERRDHILTIEDPIEYVHGSSRCVVNQRSVGPHTGSFARALRAALREDPDVIVIGELRDFETVS
ncbi:MAG TPA: ATPase, T2SS/T4P/T4SS family, partial [Myxococcota bacterium]|nr:ATPase, T2SS/T4P/T4SS family [Myxococcota bacterium]